MKMKIGGGGRGFKGFADLFGFFEISPDASLCISKCDNDVRAAPRGFDQNRVSRFCRGRFESRRMKRQKKRSLGMKCFVSHPAERLNIRIPAGSLVHLETCRTMGGKEANIPQRHVIYCTATLTPPLPFSSLRLSFCNHNTTVILRTC